eukprot:3464134-Prymnesium_polylepis.1
MPKPEGSRALRRAGWRAGLSSNSRRSSRGRLPPTVHEKFAGTRFCRRRALEAGLQKHTCWRNPVLSRVRFR